MPRVEEIVEYLQKTYKSGEKIACDIWGLDEVFTQAKNDGVELTELQANKIIDAIHRDQDPLVGITWDVLSQQIREVANGREGE